MHYELWIEKALQRVCCKAFKMAFACFDPLFSTAHSGTINNDDNANNNYDDQAEQRQKHF